MTTESMKNRIERNGYKVTRDMSQGTIVVTTPNGFRTSFKSITAAYKHYFN
jgi:hypothetical protein